MSEPVLAIEELPPGRSRELRGTATNPPSEPSPPGEHAVSRDTPSALTRVLTALGARRGPDNTNQTRYSRGHPMEPYPTRPPRGELPTGRSWRGWVLLSSLHGTQKSGHKPAVFTLLFWSRGSFQLSRLKTQAKINTDVELL